MKVSRRSFVGGVGAGMAMAGTLGAGVPEAKAQLVYMTTDWHKAEFDKLLTLKARVKQLYDAEKIDDGGVLNPMKNSLNGLHFGYGLPEPEIKVVGAFRGQANLMNFDDSMWEKYKLGEYTKTNDPKTSQPATRNIFFPKRDSKSTDVNDRSGPFHDTSIEALIGRGVTFLSCHNATEAAAIGLVKKLQLTATVEDVVHDLQAHVHTGVICVPAMVAAIAMLQCEGKYAYTMG